MKVSSNHEIFVLDGYPRQKQLLNCLGDVLENYPDQQGRETNVKATVTGWNFYVEDPEFHEWKRNILSAIERLNIFYGHKFRCNDLWANIYRKGDYTIPHDHEPCRYSFVYFLKSKPNFSPLIFEDINLKTQKKKCKLVKPIEGRVVIFPGFIKHSVPRHIHDETRITLSGNLIHESSNYN